MFNDETVFGIFKHCVELMLKLKSHRIKSNFASKRSSTSVVIPPFFKSVILRTNSIDNATLKLQAKIATKIEITLVITI